jgi:hypothetical protein
MTHHSKEVLDNYFKKRGGYRTSLEKEETWDENMLTKKIAEYLKEQHPTVPFTCDMSGVKLSKKQAIQSANNRANFYKVPDLLLFVKKGTFGMLCLELKIKSVKLFKKDGGFVKNEHLEKQRSSILWLRKYGQCADFALGYSDTIKKINDYLDKGKINYTL